MYLGITGTVTGGDDGEKQISNFGIEGWRKDGNYSTLDTGLWSIPTDSRVLESEPGLLMTV